MVTWSTYLSIVAVALLVYYGFVVLVFFRKELFGRLRPVATKVDTSRVFLAAETDPAPPPILGIRPLLDEVEAYVLQAVDSEMEASEFIEGVRRIIAKYPPLEDPAVQTGIGRLVLEMGGDRFDLHESDLEQLWRV